MSEHHVGVDSDPKQCPATRNDDQSNAQTVRRVNSFAIRSNRTPVNPLVEGLLGPISHRTGCWVKNETSELLLINRSASIDIDCRSGSLSGALDAGLAHCADGTECTS